MSRVALDGMAPRRPGPPSFVNRLAVHSTNRGSGNAYRDRIDALLSFVVHFYFDDLFRWNSARHIMSYSSAGSPQT
jgi:hypothetical protein